MSSDSIDQWSQALTGSFNDIHPAFHTMLIAVLARLRSTPALVAIVQILSLSLAAGYIFFKFDKMGIRRWVIVLAVIVFTFSPVNSAMVITIWKDVAYGIAFLTFEIFIFEIIVTEGEWLKHLRNIIFLVLIAFFVSIFRHNGFPVAFISLILLAVGFRQYSKQLLLSFVLTVGLWFGIRGPFYSYMQVVRDRRIHIYNQELFIIAAHLKAGTPLSAGDEALLNQVMPIEIFKDSYVCFTSGTFLYNPKFNHYFAAEHINELLRILLVATLRAPEVTLRHFLCSGSLVWNISSSSNPYSQYRVPIWKENGNWASIYQFPKGYLSVQTFPKLPQLTEFLYETIYNSETMKFQWLVWSPAVYLYFLIFTIITVVLRSRNWRFSFLLLPVLVQSAFIIVTSNAQDFRYQYPVYLVSLVFWPLLVYKKSTSERTAVAQPHYLRKQAP